MSIPFKHMDFSISIFSFLAQPLFLSLHLQVLCHITSSSDKAGAVPSLLRYESGLINYMIFLTAEIAFLNVSLTKIQSQTTLALNSVNLYKALGGGWQVDKTCWTQSDPLTLWPWTED